MAITYNWTISALDCIPQVDGKTDYVVTAHWSCNGDDEEGHTGSVYSTQSFTVDPNKPDYVPFDQLTEELVVGWVQDAMGEDGVVATEASVATQIENQINPPIVTPPLPWAPAPSVAPADEPA